MNENHFIGRKTEAKLLEKTVESHKSEFVAVYGRRRVGKTMLIRQVFNNTFTFKSTAIGNVGTEKQLFNFYISLEKHRGELGDKPIPENWFMAFQQLIAYLEKVPDKKKVVFLDELPWFDTDKSDFVQSLEHFLEPLGFRQKRYYTDYMWLCCLLDDQQPHQQQRGASQQGYPKDRVRAFFPKRSRTTAKTEKPRH